MDRFHYIVSELYVKISIVEKWLVLFKGLKPGFTKFSSSS